MLPSSTVLISGILSLSQFTPSLPVSYVGVAFTVVLFVVIFCFILPYHHRHQTSLIQSFQFHALHRTICLSDVFWPFVVPTFQPSITSFDTNRCRIYSKVETLADVTKANGRQIQQAALNCQSTGKISTHITRPRQPRPGKLARKSWKKFLRSLCHPKTLKLWLPLGRWHTAPSHQDWQSYYDNTTHTILFWHTNNTWHSLLCQERRFRVMDRHIVPTEYTAPNPTSAIQPLDMYIDNTTETLVSVP